MVARTRERELYFAYGSNLNLVDMARRCPTAERVRAITLRGWRLVFRGVVDIEQHKDGRVPGALWRVTEQDIRALDRYEGAPNLYRQVLVQLPGGLRAMTYVMGERKGGRLMLPSPLYLSCIAQGYKSWGLDWAHLRRALAEADEDLARRGIRFLQPNGAKRMKPARKLVTPGMSPATRATLALD